jgi:transketolase
MTMRTLEAADKLAKDGIRAGILHTPTIKPLDVETILEHCFKPGRLVITAENHSMIGGLGETVASTLMRNSVTPTFRQIALPDEFLDAGALPVLHDQYAVWHFHGRHHPADQGLAGMISVRLNVPLSITKE